MSSRRPSTASTSGASAFTQRSSRSIATTFDAPDASRERVSPPGPANFHRGSLRQVRCSDCDAPGQIQIEQEVLTQSAFCIEAVLAMTPQRRQRVNGACWRRGHRRSICYVFDYRPSAPQSSKRRQGSIHRQPPCRRFQLLYHDQETCAQTEVRA